MMDAGRHPRIELLVNSEVEDITGFVGNYRARIRRRAQHVDPVDCTACGDCVDVCPVALPDEYQEGLATRKAIYIPFPQAVPATYTLDADNCLGFNPIACGKCKEVCDKQCIDYDATDEVRDLEIGSVVVATGMDIYDPRATDEYGYCRFPDVITSMEFERLINAGGPTEGELVRPSDLAVPKRIGFIQCVGSRSPNRGVPYCSNFCCMNTIKETLLLAEHYPDSRSTVFHQDIRAFGKGFEDLYSRSREEGVRFVRGLPGAVEQDDETGELVVRVEDTLRGEIAEHRLDMLVLAVGLVPRQSNGNGRPGQRSIDEILSLSHTSDGFVMEAHPKLKPVDAPTRGVYFAGCVEAPKDVKDAVTQAGAAA
jgi:heterodisulfide reductase subunit A